MNVVLMEHGERIDGVEVLDCEQLTDQQIEECSEIIFSWAKTMITNPVTAWELSNRANNILQANQLVTTHALMNFPPHKILRLPNCGKATLYEIVNESKRQGYSLPNWEEALQRSHRDDLYRKTADRKKPEKKSEKREYARVVDIRDYKFDEGNHD